MFGEETGEFIGDYTLEVGKEQITAPKIVIASGARQIIPNIPGLKEIYSNREQEPLDAMGWEPEDKEFPANLLI